MWEIPKIFGQNQKGNFRRGTKILIVVFGAYSCEDIQEINNLNFLRGNICIQLAKGTFEYYLLAVCETFMREKRHTI